MNISIQTTESLIAALNSLAFKSENLRQQDLMRSCWAMLDRMTPICQELDIRLGRTALSSSWDWNALSTSLEAATLQGATSQQMRSWRGQARIEPTETARQIGVWLERRGWSLEAQCENGECEERWIVG